MSSIVSGSDLRSAAGEVCPVASVASSEKAVAPERSGVAPADVRRSYTAVTVALVIAAVQLVFVLVTRPVFARVFTELQFGLSPVSDYFLDAWYPMILLGMMTLTLGKEFWLRDRRRVVKVNIAAIAFFSITAVGYVVFTMRPLLALIDSLAH